MQTILLIAVLLIPQPAHEKVDQARVDAAIEKGCAWLVTQSETLRKKIFIGQRHQKAAESSFLELTVLTLAHSGLYPEDHADMKPLLEAMVQAEITTVYQAALQAMALQKINPRKFQLRIAQCAQFLVDNQAENGQWDYGEKVPLDHIKVPENDIATEGRARRTSEPKLPRIAVQRRIKGPPNGDNSNSQYAAIGLRACSDAGIALPLETLAKAREWWIKSQNKDGGWGYNHNGAHPDPAADNNPAGVSETSYGSMTSGAIGSICIYDYLLKLDFKAEVSVRAGAAWQGRNFDVTANPKKTKFAYLYSLYAMERAGILFGTEKFGTHEWYPEGANHLLDSQKPQGFWDTQDHITHQGIPDTCFAVLFLRRGTAPLIKIATKESKK